jgi:hypothetical protein
MTSSDVDPPRLPGAAASTYDSLPPAPLTWWRNLPPAALDLTAQHRLRAALLTLPHLPLPSWEAACRADPAAAVRAGLTALAHASARPEHLEAAMSAVLICAAGGDPACANLLAHVLGRRARRRADLDALCLAHRWRRRPDLRPPAPLAAGR